MSRNYYRGTVLELGRVGDNLKSRVIAENVVVYNNMVSPYVDLAFDHIYNTKTEACDMIFDMGENSSRYLDEESLVAISKEEAATRLLSDVFLESPEVPLMPEEVSAVLRKTIHK